MHSGAGVTLPLAAGVVQQRRKNAGPGISFQGIESRLPETCKFLIFSLPNLFCTAGL